MKCKVLLIVLLLAMIADKSHQGFLEETNETIAFRNSWNYNNTLNVSNGRISIEYSDETGNFCRANKNLYSKEFVFTISKEYPICGCNYYFINIYSRYVSF